jgi:sugar phosphate isomerase/epimerase
VFIAASTRCFEEKPFEDACREIVDLEYDKIDIWLDESGNHLKPSEIVASPDAFVARVHDITRLTPVALTLAHDIEPATLAALCAACKLLKVAQITVPASPLGTPFNSEIDRLKEFVGICNESGVRLSIRTETGHLTEDPHTAVELCQAVRGLGLSLDPSYYIAGPHRNQSWEQVYPYVFHTFLRDATDKEVQVQLGLGEVDYAHIIKVLEREGYRRALSVDFFPSKMDLEMRPLEMRKLRLLLETHL